MSSVKVIYEQYKLLPSKAKDELLELLNQEKISKEEKLKNRLLAIKETEPFFREIRKGLPSDYKFDREFANER